MLYTVYFTRANRPVAPLNNISPNTMWEAEVPITAKMLKRHHHIYEVPISFNPREYAEGKKIGLGDAFQAVWTLVKYRFVD